MVKVTADKILLSDEDAIREILDTLDWPLLFKSGEPPKAKPVSTPFLPFWTHYLSARKVNDKWHEKTAVWLVVTEKAGVLHKIVISGLADEKEAKVLRSEFYRRQATAKAPAGEADIEELAANVIATRGERAYQENFQYYIKRVRDYFKWENGQAVESEGHIVTISKSSLNQDDIELLRQIFTRLPNTLFDADRGQTVAIDDEHCPMCGGGETKAKNKAIKNLKAARDKVKKFSAEYADEGFSAWANARLKLTDPLGWTGSTDLHKDYVAWVKQHGGNMGERTESKRTMLNHIAWGRLMAKTFDRKPATHGVKYRVLLKRQPKSA